MVRQEVLLKKSRNTCVSLASSLKATVTQENFSRNAGLSVADVLWARHGFGERPRLYSLSAISLTWSELKYCTISLRKAEVNFGTNTLDLRLN